MRLPAMVGSAAVICVMLTGCPGGANINVDYDHNANFSKYHTFAFADVKTDNPFYEQRIEDEVTKDLEAKGLQHVNANGDLEITAVGAVHNRKEYETFYNNPGFGYYWGGFGGVGYQTTRTIHYKVGSLVLDMYDGQSKHLVWRGIASNTVSNSANQNTAKVYGAIDQLLKNFPPNTNR